MRITALLVWLGVLSPASVALAQEPVRVLVLGTYHFGNPGLDVVNAEADDVRSERRQAELAVVLDRLAAFAPTRIAVEWPADAQSRLDERYAALREGRLEPAASETDQIGLMLAARLGHERVWAIDHPQDLEIEEVIGRAMTEGPPELSAAIGAMIGEIQSEIQRLIENEPMIEIFRRLNDPEVDRFHSGYVDLARVGAGEDWQGAEMTSAWYERNLKIFAHLARIAEPGDRVVVVFGSGHGTLLRHYVNHATGFEGVPVDEVLR